MGINIRFCDTSKEIKFFLVTGVYDKPAKAAVLNMMSSTGNFGCTKCTQQGESFKQDPNGIKLIFLSNYLWRIFNHSA